MEARARQKKPIVVEAFSSIDGLGVGQAGEAVDGGVQVGVAGPGSFASICPNPISRTYYQRKRNQKSVTTRSHSLQPTPHPDPSCVICNGSLYDPQPATKLPHCHLTRHIGASRSTGPNTIQPQSANNERLNLASSFHRRGVEWTAGGFSDSACFVLQAAFFRSRKSLSASSGVRYPRAE